MSVTYTLTWEEFAEQYQDSWPRPDLMGAIITLFIALPLVAYGIAFYFLTGGFDPVWPGLFIGTPLSLLVMAWWSIKHKAAETKKRAIAQTREEFDAFYAKEQSFSFDQEKWTVATAAGKHETPWSALRQATEYQQVFALVGERSNALVPKRVLDTSVAESLRQLVLPQYEKSWSFRFRCWDYQVAATSWLWRKYRFGMAIANLLCLGVLGWAVATVVSSDNGLAGWGTILAGTAALAAVSAQLWYFPLRFITSAKRWRECMTCEFSRRGVRIKNSDYDYFMAWSSFRKLEETTRAFLLYTQASSYYLLAKEYVPTEQQTLLRQMMEEKKKQA